MAEHVTSEESELYALGVLDGEEKTAFETHLRSCDDCTRGVASAHQRVALIGLACVPETPRPAVREKIMRRILAERAAEWSPEKTAQISELRVEREPEPEPEPEPKAKLKPKADPVVELEAEPEVLVSPVAEGQGRRVQWLAAALAVLLLAGISAGLWLTHRSHQNQQAQVQQPTGESQPKPATAQAQSDQNVKLPEQKEKLVSAPKDKGRTDANRAAAAPSVAAEQPASTAAVQPETLSVTGPARISANEPRGEAPPSLAIGADMDTGRGGALPVLPGSASEPGVQEAPSGPMRVSSGVAAARLMSPIQPVYPDLARQARVQGTVVVEATISTTGRVRYVHVVSGPALLTGAALSAIQRARYRPFVLNGTPVEASTTITVIFSLSN